MAKAAEVLGDRWTLLILRELLKGSTRFNQLERGLPRISRGLLAQRLRRLEREGLIKRTVGVHGRASAYHITPAGVALQPHLEGLGRWAAEWVVGDPTRDELDAGLIVWFMHRHVDHDQLPAERTVVQFEFTKPRRERYWLVLERHDTSVCLQDPGFGIDLVVRADTVTLHRVYLGRMSLGEAMRDGLITLDGPPRLVRAFSRWFTWSTFAPYARRAQARRGEPAAARPRTRRTPQSRSIVRH